MVDRDSPARWLILLIPMLLGGATPTSRSGWDHIHHTDIPLPCDRYVYRRAGPGAVLHIVIGVLKNQINFDPNYEQLSLVWLFRCIRTVIPVLLGHLDGRLFRRC